MVFNQIYKRCKERGIGIFELERLASIAGNTIYRWKTVMPAADKLKRVADVLGCTMEELLDESEMG